jgi:dihydropteroate synthase
VIQALAPHTIVSIDTTKPVVARAALKAGAQMLNDVRGLQNTELQSISADFASCVIMHSRGTPKNMQQMVDYDDIGREVTQWLLHQAEYCRSSEVILDPGIGFAKTAAQSLRLIHDIDRLAQHGFPVLLGASRKSFIGKTLNRPNAKDRLAGSLAAVAAGYARGIKIFRVHDVRETRDIVDLLWAIDHATT